MSAKPTSKPEWTVGNPNLAQVSIEPTLGKKLAGFGASERPAHQYMNWMFYNINEWIDWLEEQADLVASAKVSYDAIVGAGGSHIDFTALLADANIANIKNVLVVSPMTVVAPIVISQNDMRIDFTPKAFIAKGPGTTLGVQISGQRVRFMNARFINFSTSGDKALQLTNTSKWCIVTGCFFANCDTGIDDLGTANGLGLNIEEVG